MAVYPGRRKGTWRVILWARLPGEARSTQREWMVPGLHREALEFEARKRVELAAGQAQEFRVAPSFSEFSKNQYQPHAEKHLKESTWRKVRIYQLATLNQHFGPKRLSSISLADVEAYKNLRSTQVRASSINNELRVLRTVLNWASGLGVRVQPLRWKKLPIRGLGRVRVWNDEQVQALYRGAKMATPELLPILVFLLNTGCRKGEAIAAEWGWVDFKAKMVRIPSNEAWQPKNGLPREVPMGDALVRLLEAGRRHPRWLFPNSLGVRYAEFPKDVFSEVRKAAGLEGGPHTTRHTFASHFLSKVADLFLLAQVLGHSHQRVTELYSHMLPDHLARARNAVNLVPETKTMVRTMAKKMSSKHTPRKRSKRH